MRIAYQWPSERYRLHNIINSLIDSRLAHTFHLPVNWNKLCCDTSIKGEPRLCLFGFCRFGCCFSVLNHLLFNPMRFASFLMQHFASCAIREANRKGESGAGWGGVFESLVTGMEWGKAIWRELLSLWSSNGARVTLQIDLWFSAFWIGLLRLLKTVLELKFSKILKRSHGHCHVIRVLAFVPISIKFQYNLQFYIINFVSLVHVGSWRVMVGSWFMEFNWTLIDTADPECCVYWLFIHNPLVIIMKRFAIYQRPLAPHSGVKTSGQSSGERTRNLAYDFTYFASLDFFLPRLASSGQFFLSLQLCSL